MPLGNPLVEDSPGQIPSMFGGGASVSALGAEAQGAVSAGPSSGGEHNTHLWVAGVMLVALALIVFLHVSGFRFSTDVGLTGR